MWDDPECLDLLYDGETFIELPARATTPSTPTAAATLWRRRSAPRWRTGASVPEAVRFGKDFIVKSVAAAYPLGAGVGPVSPLWRLDG